MTRYAITLLKGDIILLSPEEVKFIRSESSVTYINASDGEQYISVFTIKKFTEIFEGSSFFLFSQSLLVNLNNLKLINASEQEIELVCGVKLPISRRGLKGFKELLNSQLGILETT